MDDFDHADLDVNGEFDAIDMMILEEDEQKKKILQGDNTGCCLVLLLIGSSVNAGWLHNKSHLTH